MKNLFFRKSVNIALALAFSFSISFIGCSNENTPTSSNDDQSSNSSGIVLVTDNVTTEALLANGITTDSPEWAATSELREKGGKKPHIRRDDLRGILPCLQLTSEQKTQLEGFLKSHRECVKAALDAHKTATEPVRTRLKELGKSLREQVKAGTITREDAAAQMKAAQEAAKAETQAADEALKAALEACKATLYGQIAGILTADQLTIWNNWLATGEIPCPRKKDGRPRDSVRVRP